MAHVEVAPEITVTPPNKKKIVGIWKIAGILAIITAVEFLIAFTVPAETWKYTRIVVFILLTIVKAYYIVSDFMHLGHEQKALVYSIILPCIFLCWLILALLMEAQGVYDYFQEFWSYLVNGNITEAVGK